MNPRSLLPLLVPAFLVACSSSNSGNGGSSNGDGGVQNEDGGSSSGGSGSSGSGSGSSSSGSGSGSSSSGSGSGGTNPDGGSVTNPDGGPSYGPPFAAGTICNSSGLALAPPTTLKHVIVFMFENENASGVTGSSAAPYMNSIANQCGQSSAYVDNCFVEDLLSQPHYMALTSGSNCNTGLDESGTGCITTDETSTADGTLTTASIFSQVTSWKAYQESMPSVCDTGTPLGSLYAAKHNPAVFYTGLDATCAANDLAVAPVTCDPSKTMTACTPAPANAFIDDLTNDTLAAFTFFTPNLNNDMHNGTVTEGDNFFYTYLPFVLKSPAYLRGEVAVYVLWDEQLTFSGSGGPTPNFFVSPYIKAGTVSNTLVNHFSALRSIENALGINTYLGCASGTLAGATCPPGSTADLRAAIGF